MTTVFQTSQVALDGAWAIAMGIVADGVARDGRATGYTSTNAAANKVIRATAYTPQGINGQRSFSSTSAADSGAGTGAQQILLTYLDQNFAVFEETVILNGTTPVNTVGTNIAYVESIVVTQTGTPSGSNTGIIQLWTGVNATGTVWGSIAATDNQTFWAAHYVPAGVTCYLVSMEAAAYGLLGTMSLVRMGNPSLTNQPMTQIGPTLLHPAGDQREHTFTVPLGVVGPDLIVMITHPVAATADTSLGSFEYVQI